jgi:hypothetical protein
VGYEDTVVPQIVNAVLSKQNFILLGLARAGEEPHSARAYGDPRRAAALRGRMRDSR